MLLGWKFCVCSWTALWQTGKKEQGGPSYNLLTLCNLKLHYFYLSLLGCCLVILSLLSACGVYQVAAMQTRWAGESSVQFPYFYVSASCSLVFQCSPISWHVLEEGEVEMHLSANIYRHCASKATANMIALHILWESRLSVRPAMVWGVMLDRHWAFFQWRKMRNMYFPEMPHDSQLRHPSLNIGSMSKRCSHTIAPMKVKGSFSLPFSP